MIIISISYTLLLLLILQLVVIWELTGRAIIVTVELRESCHVEWPEASHHSLPILFILPHLRVVLG